MLRLLASWLLCTVLLVGCTSSSASPPPSQPLASTSSSFGSSADPSPKPTQASGAPGTAGVPLTTAPEWHAAGNMITPHAFHTATLLRDGKVLVAGGLINDRLDGMVSAAAELFDPSSESWTATGGMTEARWGHTATLLPDGRVLVAGSYVNSSDPLASAEVYDPASGRWATTGSMNQGRGGHTATLLPDGRVLVVGGGAEDTLLEGGPRSATAELYDPDTGQSATTGSMTEARKGFTATLLPDGRVLVAGGSGNFMEAELYDASTEKWTPTGSLADGRFGHTATLLRDGTVLVTGGCACSEMPPALASAEVYHPSSGTWTATGSMAKGRFGHTATLLADGTVLVVNDGLFTDRPAAAELFDPSIGRWTATASPAGARYGYTATLLLDDSVLLTGDYDDDSRASAELYDPGVGT